MCVVGCAAGAAAAGIVATHGSSGCVKMVDRVFLLIRRCREMKIGNY